MLVAVVMVRETVCIADPAGSQVVVYTVRVQWQQFSWSGESSEWQRSARSGFSGSVVGNSLNGSSRQGKKRPHEQVEEVVEEDENVQSGGEGWGGCRGKGTSGRGGVRNEAVEEGVAVMPLAFAMVRGTSSDWHCPQAAIPQAEPKAGQPSGRPSPQAEARIIWHMPKAWPMPKVGPASGRPVLRMPSPQAPLSSGHAKCCSVLRPTQEMPAIRKQISTGKRTTEKLNGANLQGAGPMNRGWVDWRAKGWDEWSSNQRGVGSNGGLLLNGGLG